MPPPLLGARLRQLRLAKKLSLKDLAALTGSSASAIHRYESGWDRFEIRTLRRLAMALGVELKIHLDPVSDPHGGSGSSRTVTSEEVFEAVAPLFWDTDLTRDHLREHPKWVLRRVLEYGDREQLGLARAFFGDDAVRLASRHRSVDPRVRRFWGVILGDEECSP